MKITNRMGVALKLHTGGKKKNVRNFIAIPRGENDVPVNLKDEKQAFRLKSMREAGMIDFDYEFKSAASEVKDVGEPKRAVATTGTDGNQNRGGRKVSKQKANES